MTDHIIFIHGVNTREAGVEPTYADALIKQLYRQNETLDNPLDLNMIPLYWGDVNQADEAALLQFYERSPLWKKMNFIGVRSNQLLQFTGDAALYISRFAGIKVIERLRLQTIAGLRQNGRPGPRPGDRFHLVTHSMGTVILYDALFSARWDPEKTSDYQGVEEIREAIFGLGAQPGQGLPLCSIHTMGSPISIFSLIMIKNGNGVMDSIPNTHDITPRLQQLLTALHTILRRKLPWRNYIHPGDPVAYPLEDLLYAMIDPQQELLEINDVLTQEPGILDPLLNTQIVGEVAEIALFGGKAHNSYWTNELVASQIFETLLQASQIAALNNPMLQDPDLTA
ncbi:hypothetical protein [Dictyobacter formicarum]|uniref:Alpha/beta hydrolase n=1 Tax=Dictyobacter formicarum TaxID=2778368 RepID=A0ABQ3VCL5_9CHLR|nr:hypothetical protein [Dictyobacter formicarum]GHO83804.1 hypothetical protein KSZ_18100 [Dictyobacter formicarum]